jgi:hypothetical protein
MWKNTAEPGRSYITIWRMRIPFWIPKATNTHSENVILISFPLQQWLHERTSVLCYAYFGCIVYTVLAHFLVELRQVFDLETEHRRFIFKIMTQFYLAVLRRLRETVWKKLPPLSGNMSGFFTTTAPPHKHEALGLEFLASSRTPVVISGLLGFYAAYCSSFLPTIRDNLSVPSSRINQSRKSLKFGQKAVPKRR